MRAALSRFFKWAISEAMILTGKPGRRHGAARGEIKRERMLTSEAIAKRLHDLRRTVATGMQAAGVLPYTVAAALNHSAAGPFGVTAIYLRDRQEEAKP